MKSNGFKIGLGILIFLFSTSLAYFTADYLDTPIQTGGYYSYSVAHSGTYWLILLGAAALYIVVGIMISKLLPISLGFLFGADVLLLHTLFKEYGGIGEVYKTFIIGAVLVAAYLFAWYKLKDSAPATV